MPPRRAWVRRRAGAPRAGPAAACRGRLAPGSSRGPSAARGPSARCRGGPGWERAGSPARRGCRSLSGVRRAPPKLRCHRFAVLYLAQNITSTILVRSYDTTPGLLAKPFGKRSPQPCRYRPLCLRVLSWSCPCTIFLKGVAGKNLSNTLKTRT